MTNAQTECDGPFEPDYEMEAAREEYVQLKIRAAHYEQALQEIAHWGTDQAAANAPEEEHLRRVIGMMRGRAKQVLKDHPHDQTK